MNMNIKTIKTIVAGIVMGTAIMTIAPRSIREREVAKAKAAKAKANVTTKANAKAKEQTRSPVNKLTPQIAKWVVQPQPKPQTKNRKVQQTPEIRKSHRDSLSELSVASLRKLATSRGIPVRLDGRVMNKTQLISRLTA